MKDTEVIARFVLLRSQGWSLHRIAGELNVSKPTLIKWSRQHQFEINNLRTMETEQLPERLFGSRSQRWEGLGRRCKQVEEELDKRKLEDLPTARLFALAQSLRTQVNEEIGEIRFHDASTNIPQKEKVYCVNDWKP